MSLRLKPYQWNWACIATGNTYPASNFAESNSDYTATLVRVVCKITNADGATFAQLDSTNGGVVINDATAGNWDFTIGAVNSPTVTGIYTVEVDCFDSDDIEATFTRGTWEIL